MTHGYDAWGQVISTATGTGNSAVTLRLTYDGLGHILTHGLAGGVLAELQGGNFGHGFLAAGLSKAVMGRFSYQDLSAPAVLARTAIAAVVGGTISRLTGGKFANGALTATMSQLFNAENITREQQAAQEVDYSNCGGGNPCVVKNEGVKTELAKLQSALSDPKNNLVPGIVSVSGGDRYFDPAKGGSISHSTGELVTPTVGLHNDQRNNRAVDIRFLETGLPRDEVIPFIESHTGFKVLNNKTKYVDGVSSLGHIHLTCNTQDCINYK